MLDSLFHRAKDEFKYDLIAMRLSAFDGFYAPYSHIDSYLNDNESDICEVAKVCHYYLSYGDLLATLDNFHIPFVKSLCKHLALKRIGTQSIDVALVIKHFDTIMSYLDIFAEEMFNWLDECSKYKGSILKSDIPSIPLHFFKYAKKIDCALSKYLLDLYLEYLLSLSQGEWTTSLKNENSIQFKLLELYHPTKVQQFFDALKAIIKSYASGESKEHLSVETVESVICISEEMGHEVNRLFMDIRDIFLNSGITKEKLKYFGKWLFKYSGLDRKTGCLEKILPSELIDDNDIILLMVQYKDVVKRMVEHAVDDSEFTDKLKSMMRGSKKEDSQLMILCDFLGLLQDESN